MKKDNYFDIGPILEGKDLILTMMQLPKRDRIQFAADRLFAAGSWICNVAFSLSNDDEFDPKIAPKLLKAALGDIRDAKKIIELTIKEDI